MTGRPPGRGPTVVVASDAFKGSLTSLEVGDAVRLGVLDVVPDARVVVVPVADGGEGTVAAALAAGWSSVAVAVHGPTGDPVTTTIAIAPTPDTVSPALGTAAPHRRSVDSTAARQRSRVDSTAAPQHSSAESAHPLSAEEAARPGAVLVEMADACGLGRLPGGVTVPLTASSRGLGDAILGALDLGAREVVVGVGGSASTDGGAGMLAALGARLLDAHGHHLPDGGASLARLAHLDLTGLDPRLATTRLVLAADVESPLLGPAGAATVFGPQKGADPDDVQLLEEALTHWADVVATTSGARPTHGSVSGRMPGAGAAGGVGFALLAVLGAERRSGAEVVLDLVGLDAALTGADLVVTGEGSLDAQTLSGKAVTGVTRRAAAHGIPVVAVCGCLALDDAGIAALGVRTAYPLSELEPDAQRSISHAPDLLRRAARRVARQWLSPAPG